MSTFYEDSDSDIDIEEEEEDTGDFFAEEEEVEGNEDDDPEINIVNFLEEVSEASADEDEAGALNQSQDRSEFLSSTEIRHLTAAFTTCDKLDVGELNFQDFTKVLSVMGKKVTKRSARRQLRPARRRNQNPRKSKRDQHDGSYDRPGRVSLSALSWRT
tara:strand:- start:699 stop:1175 length:477 start_codon:yes stop_codon:yes gene_type:complete